MNKDLFLKTVVGICAVVWLAALVFAGTVPASRELFAPFSLVVGVAGGLLWIFDRWMWSWPLVRLVVKRPDLRGTWKGKLDPEITAPAGQRSQIPAIVVVTQSATTLHIRQFTAESESITLAAAIIDEADEAQAVVGVYRNEPQARVRDRSPIHFGALRLKVSGDDDLTGDYWTDRNSKGQLALRRVSRTRAKSFPDGERLATQKEP